MPVLGQIQALLLANLHTVLPGSLLGKALHYLASQWTKLALYVTDGAYPIDNNACHAANGMTGIIRLQNYAEFDLREGVAVALMSRHNSHDFFRLAITLAEEKSHDDRHDRRRPI